MTIKEVREATVQTMIRPSTKRRLREMAAEQGTSISRLCADKIEAEFGQPEGDKS